MALLGASLSALAVVLPGAPVLVVGNGAVQLLAARLAAIRGYQTTLACVPQFIEQAKDFLWDDKYPQGSLPIKLLPIAGGDAEKGIETAAAACEGLIVAFDSEKQAMPDSALSVFLPTGSKLKRVALMSRYLNGAGMGFFPKAAKFAANAEIWAGDPDLVAQYQAQEASVRARAKEVGASTTIIRAGTLKGGASGDALMGGAGEPMFLNPAFYTIGQQDVVNWRLLYDCGALSVSLTRGDTLPGPGFSAALTATTETGGAGDSHRGAIAMALVEALRSEVAADTDFSVASSAGRDFPQGSDAWQALFKKA